MLLVKRKNSYISKMMIEEYLWNNEKIINLLKKYNIKAKYHIFGHSHNLYNFKRSDTRYLCNPIGYPNEVGYGLTEDMIKFLEFNK
jgi:hypothetical protein